MNLYHLIYFQTLARYEHYGKAAEELHITQPSLSKDIRKLEEELQVCLFEKYGRGIRLSKQGARYLDYVNEALRELEIGQDALRYELIPKGGYITLGLSLSVASCEFTNWLEGFRKECEKPVFFSCVNQTEEVLTLELKIGKLDLILCSMVSDPKIEITPLIQRPLVLVVPRGHRLFSRSSIDIQELKGERFIAHSRDTIMHDRVSSRQKPGEATPKPARESAERMTGREGFSPQLS